jgi:hypothetical protein
MIKALLVVLASLLLMGCGSVPPTPFDGALTLSVPGRIPAGEVAAIRVRAEAPDGTVAHFHTVSASGVRPHKATFSGGEAIAAFTVRQAGMVDVMVRVGAAQTAAQFEVLPGAPAGTLEPLIGPRSMMAGDDKYAHAITIPQDVYGNAADTAVHYTLQRPTGMVERHTVEMEGLLAWLPLSPGEVAGRTTLSVTAGAVHGPEGTFETVAGPPKAVTLHSEVAQLAADGQSLFEVSTGPLRDAYGNTLPDGVLVTFTAAEPGGGQRVATGTVIGGQASVMMQAPPRHGEATITAEVYGVPSDALALTFAPGPAVGEIALDLSVEDNMIVITAGPLLTGHGAFVPQGTPAHLTITDERGDTILQEVLPAKNGHCELWVHPMELSAGAYRISVTAGAAHGSMHMRVRS